MKKLLLLTIVLALLAVPALAGDPNFSLKNKTEQPIYVTVAPYHQNINLGVIKGKIHNAKTGFSTNFQYDFGQPILLNADRSLMLELPSEQMYGLNIIYNPSLREYVYAAFDIIQLLTNNGTFYVKFQQAKKGEFMLLPQEGRFGKTTEGFSLKKNVKLSKRTGQLGSKLSNQPLPFDSNKAVDFE